MLMLLAAAVAGCSTTGQPGGMFASARGTAIAFESIDGPPPAVFRKLVATLAEEAEAHRVAVVSREGAASYRVRGYLSAHVERGKTTIAWVMDVYDADQRRALRVTGQEATGQRAGRKAAEAWTAADDKVLRQIARTGMERIAAFLLAPGAPPAVTPPPEPEAATAVAFAPERAGSVQVAAMP
jgi:hypothetical protein